MIEVETYLAAVAQRIERAGGQVRRERIGPVEAMLGDVYEASAIARGHIRFTAVVAPLATVTAFAVRDFITHVHQWSLRTTHQVPGGRTEIINFAGLVSHDVQPDAVATAADKPPLQGVGSTRPVVIDLAQGQVQTFTGTRLLGMALQGTIRAKQQFLYPHPAELAAHRPPSP
ncbi:hypothetical protein [Virgisporangium aurantiacum]|uniref:Uncharacterized protein n=1 Tax=Virgisporangium aurantiacum TaxID=175570 RepID=A0A8J3ZDV3_9ACTN|nr:hypothetical protein [Virgisporangium aurantiacum]GIJ61087.1 hypothetical protein Vau01_086030 [Virgisporangium aurantiacum]